jgi:hypothetical protein
MYALELFQRGAIAGGTLNKAQRDQWSGVPVLDAQNVYDYMYHSSERQGDTIMFDLDDWPAAVPPWNRYVMTYATPKGNELVVPSWRMPLDEAAKTFLVYDMARHFPDWRSMIVQKGATSVMQLDALLRTRHDAEVLLIGSLFIPIKEDSSIGRDVLYITSPAAMELYPGKKIHHAAAAVSIAAWSFANCRNTQRIEVPLSRQVRRQAERRGDPIFKHYVLEIGGLKRLLHTEGKIGEHGNLKQALHICRGHFSCYGEQYGTKKLFGKHEGRFWVPQHVRGSLDRGLITKDYIVKAATA